MKNNLQEIMSRSEMLERELISRFLVDIKTVAVAMQLLSPEDFCSYGKPYLVAVDCFKTGKDFMSELALKKLPISPFFHPSSREVDRISKDIISCANAIRITRTLEESFTNVPHEDLDKFVAETQKKLINAVSGKAYESGSITNALSEYRKLQEFYKEKIKKGGIIGIPTGYGKIDDAIDGFRQGHLWIIGGYTNMGKTSAALNLVANLSRQGKRAVIYSLEMSRTDILSRLLGIMTEDSGLSIVKGYARNPVSVEAAMKTLESSDMTMYCGKNELSEIQMSMYEEELKKHVDLFVVDFLQIVTVKGSKSEYETITNSALGFQQIAKKLGVPVLLLSQISNDGARNPDQDVMTFKGSGSIASAADLAIEIVRSGEDKAKWISDLQQGLPVDMKWLIRKNRHGRVGYVDMKFNGKTGVFKPDDIII